MILSARHLHKTFDAPAPVSLLTDVSIDIAPGEAVAITGRSGEGKTTLLHILGALEPFDRGELLFQGRPLHRHNGAEWRNQHVGFIFQAFNLLEDWTALENVLMPAQIGRRSPSHAHGLNLLAQVGLSHRAHYPAKLLSGGERQRVALARALCNDPALLLADEPSGNLDQTNGNEVRELLFNLVRSKGKTLILVTHDKEFASRCDRQFVLSQGLLRIE